MPHKLLCAPSPSLSLSVAEAEAEGGVIYGLRSFRFDLNRLVVHSYRFYSYSYSMPLPGVPCKKVVALALESRSGCISCPYKSTLFADLRQMGVCHTIYLHCKFNLFPAATTTIAASRDRPEWVCGTTILPV